MYPGTEVATNWPKNGPPVVWQKQVGPGFSGPVVAAGKLILFHRIEDKETSEALDAKTGKQFWSFDYPTAYRDDFGFDEGPRATPAIVDGRVYTFGAEGMLTCVDAEHGKKLWSVDTKVEFHTAKGFFGRASSPLVEGEAVIMILGGKAGAGLVAFDRKNGKVLWKTTNDEASYSSPVAATINGQQVVLAVTLSELAGVEPASGKALFGYPFRPPIRSSVTAATPVVNGNEIFISASYNTGAAMLRVAGASTMSVEKVWASEDALSCHYATPILHNGFLYGIHGRTDPGFEPAASLRCIEWKSGKVQWERQNFGAATLMLVGEALLILNERGELLRVATSPTGYKETARAQVLPNQVRAHPALADGLFYARSKDKLVCLDLTKR